MRKRPARLTTDARHPKRLDSQLVKILDNFGVTVAKERLVDAVVSRVLAGLKLDDPKTPKYVGVLSYDHDVSNAIYRRVFERLNQAKFFCEVIFLLRVICARHGAPRGVVQLIQKELDAYPWSIIVNNGDARYVEAQRIPFSLYNNERSRIIKQVRFTVTGSKDLNYFRVTGRCPNLHVTDPRCFEGEEARWLRIFDQSHHNYRVYVTN